jgi:hypothetical protein
MKACAPCGKLNSYSRAREIHMINKNASGIIQVAVANPVSLQRITRMEWALAALIAAWSGSVLAIAIMRLI